MMRRALLTLGFLGAAGLIATAVLGYGAHTASETEMRAHVLVSLGASLVLMFSHTWIVLYLIATGQVITRVVRERGYEPEILEAARKLRMHTLPWLLAALGAVIATFVVGGAAYSGALPGIVHHVLFYVTLVAQAGAMVVESRVLQAQDRLALDLTRRAEANAA
jgi:hypothetical protein